MSEATKPAPARAEDYAAALLADLGAMSGMKLQKLLYYIQSWHLARFGQRAFTQDIEAWALGPVIRSIYRESRGTFLVSAIPSGHAESLGDSQLEVLRWVSESYGRFSAEELSAMTHVEVPWLVAREGLPEGVPSDNLIRDDVMRDFYARQTLSPAEAVESAAASAALEGVEVDDEWQRAVLAAVDDPGEVDRLIKRRLRQSSVQ